MNETKTYFDIAVGRICDHARDYKESHDITMEHMASLLGMSRRQLHAKLSGESSWTFEDVFNLSRLTGRTIDQLIS